MLTRTKVARESSTNPSSDGAKRDTLGSSLRKAECLKDKPDREDADRSFLSFAQVHHTLGGPPHRRALLPKTVQENLGLCCHHDIQFRDCNSKGCAPCKVLEKPTTCTSRTSERKACKLQRFSLNWATVPLSAHRLGSPVRPT